MSATAKPTAAYVSKPPSGPACDPKPPSGPTYTPTPHPGPTYDTKPPSGPKYDDKPSTDTKYDAKPPSDPTYDNKPSGPTYDTKPPSGPTYTPKPDPTYNPKPPSGPDYNAKPPSGPTYDAKPPSGPTYEAKPPSGPTYTTTPTPGNNYDYKPSGPTYKPTPPENTYDTKPYHGPGYVHKDCSCGTLIPEDCTCTIVKTVLIQGRIREDVKKCSYEFDLPCNHVAILYGVRTAIYEQIVDVTIRRKSERKPYKEWTFEGKNDSTLLNLEGSSDAYNLNIMPEGTDRVVVITFLSYINSEYKSSDMRFKEVVISTDTSSQCSYFYTFFVEAGDDCDYHDTDFCASILPTKK